MSRPRKVGRLAGGKTGLVPALERSPDGFLLPIAWNFRKMQTGPDCGWRCTFRRLSRHVGRLLSFEGKSFMEIEQEAGSSHAWENMGRLNPEFQKILNSLNLENEALWQLELSGRARLFGVREGNIFHVMWLDENHTICPVSKKRT